MCYNNRNENEKKRNHTILIFFKSDMNEYIVAGEPNMYILNPKTQTQITKHRGTANNSPKKELHGILKMTHSLKAETEGRGEQMGQREIKWQDSGFNRPYH